MRSQAYSNPKLVPPGGWRGGWPYVRLGPSYNDQRAWFTLACWPDEDHEGLATRLNDLISPVVDRVYDGRVGRWRPTDILPLPLPSQEDLLERFEEREPGVLYWNKDLINSGGGLQKKVGDLVGWRMQGYWFVSINNTRYLRSRIIWKMHSGEDPLNDLDHKDQDTSNDRIENLQDVPAGKNVRNKGRHDGSSYVIHQQDADGVYRIWFGLAFWPDEPAEDIAAELNDLITPEIDAVYAARVGRRRPWRRPSWWPPELSAPLLRGRAL